MARVKPLVLLPPLIFAGLAALFFMGMQREDPDALPSAVAGSPAPAVAVVPLGEAPVLDPALLKAPGVKLVNFWASWCAPCRVEHPVLMGLAETDAVKQGKVALVGMNYKDEAENARRFLGALGNPFSAVGTDQAGRGAIEWGVYGVPETFVIGPDGHILDKHVGPLDQMAASKLLQRALKAR